MYDTNAASLATSVASAVITSSNVSSLISSAIGGALSGITTAKVDQQTLGGNAVALAAGTHAAFVSANASVTAPGTPVTVSGDAKLIAFQIAPGTGTGTGAPAGGFGVNVTITSGAVQAGGHVEGAAVATTTATHTAGRTVIGTALADKITIGDKVNSVVIAGDKDTIVAGSGFDTVVAAQGKSTIVGASNGQTVVQAGGTEADYKVTVSKGHAVINNTKTGVGADITQAQYVQLDGKDALIFAKDVKQAEVASLFESMLGRNADADGLQFWFAEAAKGTSMSNIAKGIAASTEYKLGTGTNDAFLDALYHNTFNRAGDTGGLTFWKDKLDHGMSRTDVAMWFAHTAAFNVDGTVHTEADIVGSVTIVNGII